MASNTFSLNMEQVERLQQTMEQYGSNAGRTVDEVLHNEGGKLIQEEIMRLLPSSGREWRGKKAAAKNTQPFRQYDGPMSVTIASKTAYNYLYFPDDGTSTKHHIGYKGKPRMFMMGGAEKQTARIMDLCVNRLIEKMGE